MQQTSSDHQMSCSSLEKCQPGQVLYFREHKYHTQSTRPGARAGGLSYLECCTSADSRPAPWAAPPSSGCPASSPAARAAGRGHSSSAPQLRPAPLSCRVRRAMNLPVPTVLNTRATLESPGRPFKNLHVRATLQMDHIRISGGRALSQNFYFTDD